MRMGLMMMVLLGIAFGAKGAYRADIDVVKMQALIQKGAKVIDIRTAPEWKQTGVIRGAHQITFFDAMGRYDIKQFLANVNRIAKKSDPIVIICRSGSRSVPVSDLLGRVGYEEVYNQNRGILEWISKGYPLVKP